MQHYRCTTIPLILIGAYAPCAPTRLAGAFVLPRSRASCWMRLGIPHSGAGLCALPETELSE